MSLTQRYYQTALSIFIPLSILSNFSEFNKTWPKVIQVKLSSDGCHTGDIYIAAVAQTNQEKKKGLSNRLEPLSQNEAMIFIWLQEVPGVFWMRDTWIPLTVIFFNSKGVLLSAIDMPVEIDPEYPRHRYFKPPEATIAMEIQGEKSLDFNFDPIQILCIESNEFLNFK